MFTTLIAVIFTLVLVVGLPALSYSTARNPEVKKLSRLDLYLSAVLSQWMLAVVGLGVVYLIARKVFVKGFAAMPLVAFLEWGRGNRRRRNSGAYAGDLVRATGLASART